MSKKEQKNDQSQQVRFLQISYPNDLRSLHPKNAPDHHSNISIKMLFEGLMRKNPEGRIIPAAAEYYEISEDQKTYTFYIRPANWSNGTPVTAYDFEYAWKKSINPLYGSSAAHHFYSIKNVQALIEGNAQLENVGIKALDEKRLVIELVHPTPYFLELLTIGCFVPISRDVDQANPQWAEKAGAAFVCNGPFVLKEWHRERELVLVKNATFWDAKNVRLPGIHISIIKDPSTRLIMYEKGELDWSGKPFSGLPLDAIPILRKKRNLKIMDALGVSWLFVNTKTVPFNHPKMRRAFALAIDRKALVRYILQEGESSALSVLPASLALQKEPYFPDGAVLEARKLFEEALEEMQLSRQELSSIRLSWTNIPFNARLAQEVQQQLQKAFNLPIILELEEWKVHFDKLIKGQYELGGMTWVSWLKDPIYMLQNFRSRLDSVNFTGWESSRFQVFLDAANKESDIKKRSEFFHQAEQVLMDEMPVIPLFFTTCCYEHVENLKNYCLSEDLMIDFRWAYFEDSASK